MISYWALPFVLKVAQEETLQYCAPALHVGLCVSSAARSLEREIAVENEFWLFLSMNYRLEIKMTRGLLRLQIVNRAPWPHNGSRYDMSCWRKMATLEGEGKVSERQGKASRSLEG